MRPNNLGASLDAVGLNEQIAHQRREQRHRVLRLVAADGRDLNPRATVGLADRHALGVEVREPRRPHELDQAHHRGERVLAVTLEPLKNPGPVDELAILVDRVPPENPAQLLRSERPVPTVEPVEVLGTPRDDLPPERQLRQLPLTARVVFQPAEATGLVLPGQPEVVRLQRVDFLGGEGGSSHSHPLCGALNHEPE